LSCPITKMKKKLKSVLTIVCLALMFTSCQKKDFKLSSGTNDLFHVKNGDYLIPVLVRGNTASKKIILFIQGGPGSNTLDFAKVDYPGWKNTLENEYAIAYYDQRGTGNSQGNFTFGQSIYTTYTDDLHKVAAFLQKAYNADVIMLGHSFGGGLMYEYMIRYGNSGIPVKYISSNGPATTDSDSDTLRWKFRRDFLYNTANLEISRNTRVSEWNAVLQWLGATPEIKKIEGSDPNKLKKQWNKYVEELVYKYYPTKSPKIRDYLKVLFLSSYNPFPSFLSSKERENLELLFADEDNLGYSNGGHLMNRLTQINSQSILLITGRYDDVCPPEELNHIYNQLSSTQKRIQIIDYSGHEIFTNQSTEFFNAIKSFIQ
jgi:pimeloyl-ACP methyl ester carboxylesterase